MPSTPRTRRERQHVHAARADRRADRHRPLRALDGARRRAGLERRAALSPRAGRGRRGARGDPRAPARQGPHGVHMGDRHARDARRSRRAAARARARRRRADAARRRHGADRAACAAAAGRRGAARDDRRRAFCGRAHRRGRVRRPGPDREPPEREPDPDNVVYLAYVDGEPVARGVGVVLRARACRSSAARRCPRRAAGARTARWSPRAGRTQSRAAPRRSSPRRRRCRGRSSRQLGFRELCEIRILLDKFGAVT